MRVGGGDACAFQGDRRFRHGTCATLSRLFLMLATFAGCAPRARPVATLPHAPTSAPSPEPVPRLLPLPIKFEGAGVPLPFPPASGVWRVHPRKADLPREIASLPDGRLLVADYWGGAWAFDPKTGEQRSARLRGIAELLGGAATAGGFAYVGWGGRTFVTSDVLDGHHRRGPEFVRRHGVERHREPRIEAPLGGRSRRSAAVPAGLPSAVSERRSRLRLRLHPLSQRWRGGFTTAR